MAMCVSLYRRVHSRVEWKVDMHMSRYDECNGDPLRYKRLRTGEKQGSHCRIAPWIR